MFSDSHSFLFLKGDGSVFVFLHIILWGDNMKKNKYCIEKYVSLLSCHPHACAHIKGSEAYSQLHGLIRFYQTDNGTLIASEIYGLPSTGEICRSPVFGFHIHEGSKCEGDTHDMFSKTMGHYNPEKCPHPFHSGDLPPLFGNHGYAFSVFLTDKFTVSEIIDKTVVIHGNPDDFETQPSGNSGEKLACGVVSTCMNRCNLSKKGV